MIIPCKICNGPVEKYRNKDICISCEKKSQEKYSSNTSLQLNQDEYDCIENEEENINIE